MGRLAERAVLGITLVASLAVVIAARPETFSDLWWTRDQQGLKLLADGEPEAAAERFVDPRWKGVAAYRGADYKAADGHFARDISAEGWFNRGVARARARRYRAAAAAFTTALEQRPGWKEAEENRALMTRILKAQEEEEGEPGDPHFNPDEVKVDEQGKKGKRGEVEVEQLTEEQLEQLWMRRLQTSPAAFLKQKFAAEVEAP